MHVAVSSDSAISIAFGLLSIVIGLLGVMIGYLTLRKMASGIHPVLTSYPLCLFSSRTNVRNTGEDSGLAPAQHQHILHHEHTHFVSTFPSAAFRSTRKRVPSMA